MQSKMSSRINSIGNSEAQMRVKEQRNLRDSLEGELWSWDILNIRNDCMVRLLNVIVGRVHENSTIRNLSRSKDTEESEDQQWA